MKCDECSGNVIVDRQAVRRYDVGGLPHVELQGVEVERCEGCGKEEVAIPRIAQLHRVLADTLVKQPRMLAPAEVRFLRKHVALCTAEFAEMMGVARETVSRWESGGQPMGAVADRLLRLIILSHTPAENYAVEDLLRSLNDTPAPEFPTAVAMCNNSKSGWTLGGRKRKLAAV